ncbi:unnamed protein product [Blepharisma stoltei]|uniref:Transcription factor CBF/NF-Y/archaeal histone domain-containing protein n=1 Tax=Blepharisma stoltei TaxID=1481888 RepID=A0AAU9JYA2_9CILI|nr:unnamed protein product [Blepharisma stoltei]
MEPKDQNSEQFPLFNLYPMPSGVSSSLNSVGFNTNEEQADNSLEVSVNKLIKSQLDEIVTSDLSKLNHHEIPLARVKKIMKADEDVKMINAETPAIFGKACELFIIELTHRAWVHTEESKRRTLQRSDIIMCIFKTDIFDFMQEIITQEKKNY